MIRDRHLWRSVATVLPVLAGASAARVQAPELQPVDTVESAVAQFVYDLSKDGASAEAAGGGAVDTDWPSILSIWSEPVSDSKVRIHWTADEPTKGWVAWGVNAQSSAWKEDLSGVVEEHVVTISGLDSSKDYDYGIVVADPAGNVIASPVAQLSWTDSQPPELSSVKVGQKSADRVRIKWDTDEPSFGSVEYGLGTDYGATVLPGELDTTHVVYLYDLEPGETYHFRVAGWDPAGNKVSDTDRTFVFEDLLDPTISDVKVVHEESWTDWVRIGWDTDEPTTGTVHYGLTDSYGLFVPGDGELATSHNLKVDGLTQGQTYHFSVASADAWGNEVFSPDGTFLVPVTDDDVPPIVGDDGEGWTEFELHPNARTFYVSSSIGKSSNSGLTPDKPLATLAQGAAKLRSGFGDWLLLRRGDTFLDSFGVIADLRGKSADYPVLIGAYGELEDPRPIISPPASMNAIHVKGEASHFALMSLHFKSRDNNGIHGARGIYWRGDGRNLLIEDCLVEGFAHNVTALGDGDFEDFRMRRTVVVDSFNTEGQSQGVFIDEVDGVLLEQCVFDHNGWHETKAGAKQSVYNRNVYITSKCSDVTWRENISTNSSSDGGQMRAGGVLENSVFIANSTGFTLGLVRGGSEPVPGGVTGVIVGNVVLQSNDIETHTPLLRGTGFVVANLTSGYIADNIVAHPDSAGTFGNAISLEGDIKDEVDIGLHNVVIEDNLVYDWHQAIDFESGTSGVHITDVVIRHNQIQTPSSYEKNYGRLVSHAKPPTSAISYFGNVYWTASPADKWFEIGKTNLSLNGWVTQSGEEAAIKLNAKPHYEDPNRDAGTYVDDLEGTSGSDLDDFLFRVRSQRKGNFDPNYQALEFIEYVRAGFGLTPLN